jgi:two-component system, NtrC family, sensor kinase
MKRFLRDIFVPTGAGRHGRAEWSLHWLLAASIMLPLLGFAAGSVITYRQTEQDARDRLQRNLSTVHEHALKVLETIELASRYLDEVFGDVADQQIRDNEAGYNRRLRALTDTLPQFADIWVIDADGRPLVSGTVFPIPRWLDLSDRGYFRAHRNGEATGLYVDDVVTSRATNARGQPRFFALSRRRAGPGGGFAGVIVMSISPDYFQDYYATLPPPIVAALIRADGAVLARYPELPQPEGARLAGGSELGRQLAQKQEQGTITTTSALDGKERMISFRKLPRIDVYMSAGVDLADIRAATIRTMASHLIFGLPATAAMILLCLMALRRARREAVAGEMLRAEIARREATEEALRQAQKMEAIGRLTGGIAHDFNNLLTAIIGNLDLALRRLDGEERVRGWLSNSRKAGERAATLVQRLLAFSRQHPLETKSVDINRLVQEMSDLLRRTIGETVMVETVLAGGLWKAAIDPNQLENTILNLAVNARDAMPEGGRLTIESANCHLDEHYVEQAGADIPPGQYVMVAVSDSGTGMPREVMDRAFEPFFTTKPPGTGTGLGLSQAYGFAKQSGGHIRIYSESGVGTTVKLYFPRLTAQADVPLWGARETAAPQPARRGSETVLVVEDDPQVKSLAIEALEDQGYRVLSADDGPSALRTIEGAPPIDLLLSDVVLPNGMNGRELAQEILRLRPGVKVLYVTGYTRNAIIHHGRLDPDIDLLTKPFTPEALTRKIRIILDGGKARGGPATEG